MNNDTGQGLKPAVIPPNTPDDQRELFRRIHQIQSRAAKPLPVHPSQSGRQNRYAERAPEAHSA